MITSTETGGATINGGGCRWCSKNDFLPEESFKSWSNYFKALQECKTRLNDRLLARSLDDTELNQIRSRSRHSMKKTLTWWDLLWFGLGAVMGAGIFVLTGLTSREQAGPAVVLSFFASGVSALLSVLCYTEFTVEIPVAGGSFAYLRVELGDFVAFIAAGNILFEYIVAGASVARLWTSYFATLCNHSPDGFRIIVSGLGENYNHLDPIAVAISIIIGFVAIASTKGSSPNPNNLSDFAPFGVRGIFKASAVLFFAYVGFDGVATMAEETKNPGRDIPIGLIGSMVITIFLYCLLAVTLCLMQPYTMIDVDAPFTMAFQTMGMNWAKYIVALGALQGMTTVLLTNIIGQARYFTYIGRTHMAPPWLTAINERTGTPVNATIVMTIANCIIALFTNLEVLSNLLSISTLFIFALVALALMVRRYYVTGETPESDRNWLIGFLVLIVGSSVVTMVYWAVTDEGWIGYVVTLPVWFFATLGLKMKVKEAKSPKIWGVPLFPWLPSASIAVNVFLLGSIDVPSFVRFGVWSLILLVYYFFVGLHASYDAAKEADREANATRMCTAEAGIVAQPA
ncbi:hypothetical protein NE237_032283 [Protea cynaroides]|uniref:Cationic amino acid transporter C-terminal domain-containing protein n=1 Tax=Protea cynaroides TaxID=273540 RepID=A0A9Q0L371_9MAGN|nr:hypothetical protein NE237_032283 [Protea cynaroides]